MKILIWADNASIDFPEIFRGGGSYICISVMNGWGFVDKCEVVIKCVDKNLDGFDKCSTYNEVLERERVVSCDRSVINRHASQWI